VGLTKAIGVVLLAVVAPACSGQSHAVTVPSNHGHTLDDALRRLHRAGLRATFPAASQPCGDASLPRVNVQTPRAPARVHRGRVVTLRLEMSPIPTPAIPLHPRAVWSVPNFVGQPWPPSAFHELEGTAVMPCLRVRGAVATTATQFVVAAQNPQPGMHRHPLRTIYLTAQAR
jgi:hypothetical protein